MAPVGHRRQGGGARRESSAPVRLEDGDSGTVLEGWTLNESKGGIRVVLDEPAELGRLYLLLLTGADGALRQLRGRVVWVQDERDGQIAGIQFEGCQVPAT